MIRHCSLMRIEWKPPRSPFNFSNLFEGGTRKSSKRLAALIASSLRFARGAMLRNSRTTPSQNSVSVRLSPNDPIMTKIIPDTGMRARDFGLRLVGKSRSRNSIKSSRCGRHCEKRSDEAIHAFRGPMDCFASLAMTTERVSAKPVYRKGNGISAEHAAQVLRDLEQRRIVLDLAL